MLVRGSDSQRDEIETVPTEATSLGALAIVTMLFAPRGLWGLISDRTGWELFPVRRLLRGGPVLPNEKGGPNG